MLTIDTVLAQLEAKGFAIKSHKNGLRYAIKGDTEVDFCLWNSTTGAVQTTRIHRVHGLPGRDDQYLTAVGLKKWISVL